MSPQCLPHIAVLLAAHNGRRWLPQQLESIQKQDGVELTIYVSVDASDDGTEAWIDEQARLDPRIQVLPHGGQFGSGTQNFFHLIRALKAENYDFISLADHDDIWLPSKLQRACQQLEKQEADAFSSNVIAFWPDGRRCHLDKAQPPVKWDYLFEAAGPGCSYVLNRRLFLQLQAHLVDKAEDLQAVALHDWYIYAYARSHGFRWHIDHYPGLLYRQHAGNSVGVNMGWHSTLKRLFRLLDGWWLHQSRLLAELCELGDSDFVQECLSGKRRGFFRLFLLARHCRRRKRDQLAFALSALILSIVPRQLRLHSREPQRLLR